MYFTMYVKNRVMCEKLELKNCILAFSSQYL